VPRPLTRNRSTQLDVVRGVAILAVVMVHTFQSSIEQFPLSLISESSRVFVGMSYLRFGVELFFLLSGWLIFSMYFAKPKQVTTTYVGRRFARIWPLWFIFSLLSFTALISQWDSNPVSSGYSAQTIYEWIFSFVIVILFLGWLSPELWNVPPGGWSIQVEVGHYSLFWVLRRARTVIPLVSILVGYFTYFAAVWISNQEVWLWVKLFSNGWLRLGLYGTWPFFVFGGLAFMCWVTLKERGLIKTINQVQKRIVIFILVILILIVARDIPIPFGMTYEALLTCIFLLAVSWLISRWALLRRGTAFLGRYSYFIYFAHFWILVFVSPWIFELLSPLGASKLLTFWGVFFVTLVVTLIASTLAAVPSWKFFESRLIDKAHAS